MTTMTLDLATICQALDELEHRSLGEGCAWLPANPTQEQLVKYFQQYRSGLRLLHGLEGRVATSYRKLNQFLEDRGFDPLFQPFNGLGVASVIDMTVEWILKGMDGMITHQGSMQAYPAFELSAEAVEMFDVDGFKHPLARLKTTTGDNLWLMKADQPSSGMDLVVMAHKIIDSAREVHTEWTNGVMIPKLDISVQPDMGWIIGLGTQGRRGHFRVEQAFQQVRIRVNEFGARCKVASGLASESCRVATSPDGIYQMNEAFAGFFTQKDSDLPIAAFWTDVDTWVEPRGSLEDL